VFVGKFQQAPTSASSTTPVVDLGDGTIVPGFVNAHTHLEFSELEQPIGEKGIEFTQWIRLVVAQRGAVNDSLGKAKAIQRGLTESMESGTSAIGEIATLPFESTHYSNSDGLLKVVFLEQLGRGSETSQVKQKELEDFFAEGQGMLSNASNAISNFSLGASPHAPYSVGQDLLRQMITQSIAHQRPLAMHLAETKAEREFIENTSGPFVDLMKDFGIWDPKNYSNQLSIFETLALLSSAPAALIVHGNYLSTEELDFIAEQSARLSIAFCPRTHDFFGHDTYPIAEILDRKINLCLGTDSRASNPDLNLMREMQQISQSFPHLDPQLILKMGTLNGAIALGLTESHGTLEIGKSAMMNFVTHPDAANGKLPWDWMFDGDATCQPIR
jgi:cytosine/adenosine deaminase-related metal-dependent hydrolase